MKIVGATEYALVLYRDKLPKFNNGRQIDEETGKPIRGTGKMVFNWFEWKRDNSKEYPKIHPTQKPISVFKATYRDFHRRGDVIDPAQGVLQLREDMNSDVTVADLKYRKSNTILQLKNSEWHRKSRPLQQQELWFRKII